MERMQSFIFSFYREEPDILIKLSPVLSCQITWILGVIRIECLSIEHREKVGTLIEYLRLPFAELGMGRQIVLRAPGSVERIFPMHLSSQSDLFA